MLLTAVSGFLDAYTYLRRGGVFATAQTGNVVLLALDVSQRHFALGLRKVYSLGGFAAGVVVAEFVRRRPVAGRVHRPARVVLLLEMVTLVVVGALPASVPDPVAAVPVAFVASLQLTTFRTLVSWPVSTSMTTSNMRSALSAVYAALIDHDHEQTRRAKSFGAVVLGFFCGALVGTVLSAHIGLQAAWAAAALLVVAVLLFRLDERDRIPGCRQAPPYPPTRNTSPG